MAASHTVPPSHNGLELKRIGHKRTTIDRMLECAVTLNWKDLTQSDEAASIQVEYRTGPQHSLEYLKLWSSKERGYWHLVAEYWMHSSAAHESGASFSDGNYSADLALMLDAIMQHQEGFLPTFARFLGRFSPDQEAKRKRLGRSQRRNDRSNGSYRLPHGSHVNLSGNRTELFFAVAIHTSAAAYCAHLTSLQGAERIFLSMR